MSPAALRWFAHDTVHIVLIHIPSVVKLVHISVARNRFFKSCLMTELCSHHFLHFDCVQISVYIYIYIYTHTHTHTKIKKSKTRFVGVNIKQKKKTHF